MTNSLSQPSGFGLGQGGSGGGVGSRLSPRPGIGLGPWGITRWGTTAWSMLRKTNPEITVILPARHICTHLHTQGWIEQLLKLNFWVHSCLYWIQEEAVREGSFCRILHRAEEWLSLFQTISVKYQTVWKKTATFTCNFFAAFLSCLHLEDFYCLITAEKRWFSWK